MKNKQALIIVDAQNDFMPGGSLAVPNGNEIIPVINALLPNFELIIFTQDWHPENHKSFASQHKDKKVYDKINLNGLDQILWPDHCIQNSYGANIHKEIDLGKITGNFYIFKKGMDPEVDSYSGFYDNGKKNSTGLAEFLKERDVKTVNIVGLALDFCVAYTAIDAASEGFKTFVIADGTRAITKSDKEMNELFKNNNVKFIYLEL